MGNEVAVLENGHELSGITVGENFDLESIKSLSGKKQKDAARDRLANLKREINEMSFKMLQLQVDIKKVDNQLKKHPVIQKFNEMKKQSRKYKNRLEILSGLYRGGVGMVSVLGIKLDAKTLKELKEDNLL